MKFGMDVSRDFCARNSLKMIVRSHQYWIEFPGYKIHHEGRVVTVMLPWTLTVHHMSRVTCHTSHFTRHTSHVIRHTSRIIRLAFLSTLRPGVFRRKLLRVRTQRRCCHAHGRERLARDCRHIQDHSCIHGQQLMPQAAQAPTCRRLLTAHTTCMTCIVYRVPLPSAHCPGCILIFGKI